MIRRVSTPPIAAMPRLSSQRRELAGRCANWPGSVIGAADHHASGIGCERLDVLVVGADVADVREGEGDDLTGVGGIGEDLLVPGDGCVEDQFAYVHAGTAAAETEKYRPVRERERGVRVAPVESGHDGIIQRRVA